MKNNNNRAVEKLNMHIWSTAPAISENTKQLQDKLNELIEMFNCANGTTANDDSVLNIFSVIPRYFKERRQRLNMSMQDVTDKTDISKATISRVERGQDAFFKTVVTLDRFYSDNGV